MTDYAALAMTMPCDESLLPFIGRVNWAAARLHHGVRDAINEIKGTPSDKPFEPTLGGVVSQLEQLADHRLAEPDRGHVREWCARVARPAVDRRNKVIHAVAFTATDGKQGIRTVDDSPPGRFLEPDLIEVAGQLVHAHAALPPWPYTLKT
ncbi:hypothetical protein [Blastococcus sp. SYSU DS0539]